LKSTGAAGTSIPSPNAASLAEALEAGARADLEDAERPGFDWEEDSMPEPVLSVTEVGAYRLVKIAIPEGITTPREFAASVGRLDLSGDEPVLLNGRAPVWGYAMLVHQAHATPAIAAFDPRLGYVVVASHDPRFTVGAVLDDIELGDA